MISIFLLILRNVLFILLLFRFFNLKYKNEEYGDFYNRIFGFRQRGDYEDFVEFDYEKVKSWFDKTKDFINSIEQVIRKAMDKTDI